MEAAPDRSFQQRVFCEFISPPLAASRLLYRFLDDDTHGLRDLDVVTGARPQPELQAQPGLQGCDKFVRTVLGNRMELGREEQETALKENKKETIVTQYRLPGEGSSTGGVVRLSYTGDGKYRPPTEFKLKSLLRSRKKF